MIFSSFLKRDQNSIFSLDQISVSGINIQNLDFHFFLSEISTENGFSINSGSSSAVKWHQEESERI